jgi:hypothetical protein
MPNSSFQSSRYNSSRDSNAALSKTLHIILSFSSPTLLHFSFRAPLQMLLICCSSWQRSVRRAYTYCTSLHISIDFSLPLFHYYDCADASLCRVSFALGGLLKVL